MTIFNNSDQVIITNLNELHRLKARSRLPVNINNVQSAINFSYLSKLNIKEQQLDEQHLMDDISSDSGISSSSTTTSMLSVNIQDDLVEYPEMDDINKMKLKCHELFVKFKSCNNLHTMFKYSPTKLKRKFKHKQLTILFDYCNNNTDFYVKQGEIVNLIRDLNDKFYVVSKIIDGKLGTVPKDYTIDMKEIKYKVKLNSKRLSEDNVKLTHL
jgi:hypothetical protein